MADAGCISSVMAMGLPRSCSNLVRATAAGSGSRTSRVCRRSCLPSLGSPGCAIYDRVAALAVSLMLVAAASAAFPGRNGMLAVKPLYGAGTVLVGTNGRGEHRVCLRLSVCGHPGRPQFSPDGRSIVFAGPAVRLVGTDGVCENCRFGAAAAPAFRGDGTLVTFISGATVFEDSIDGIRRATVVSPATVRSRTVSAAVWSVRGNARGGRTRTHMDWHAWSAAIHRAGERPVLVSRWVADRVRPPAAGSSFGVSPHPRLGVSSVGPRRRSLRMVDRSRSSTGGTALR